MKLQHPDLQSRLAAEYVLGTMKGAARRRFEDYVARDRSLADMVAKWEAHLTPLAERVSPVTPPRRVWRKIEARTFGAQTPDAAGVLGKNGLKHRTSGGLLSSLAFWRGLGVSASGLAFALLLVVFTGRQSLDSTNMLTAVLEDKGEARMVVEQPKQGLLQVKVVKRWKPAPDNSLQLWILPDNGTPRSIGIIEQDGTTKIALQELEGLLDGGVAFALSKEPRGGSPTGQPTGMILCKGVIAKMPQKKAPGTI